MTNYFVRTGGNDANNGLTAATAWKTLTKALSAGAGPVAGDTVYVGGGTYRELVTLGQTFAAPGLTLIGDIYGAQTGDPGYPRVSNYLAGDTSTPTNQSLLSLGARGGLNFQRFSFISGATGANPAVVSSTTFPGAVNFTNCVFTAPQVTGVSLVTTSAVSLNSTFESCLFHTAAGCVTVTAPLGAADYDVAVTMRNCKAHLMGGSSVFFKVTQASGAGTGKPGGGLVEQCTVLGGNIAILQVGTNISATIPMHVYDSIIYGCATGISASVSGGIIEDGCYISASTSFRNANVTVGGNSIPAAGNTTVGATNTVSYAPLFEFGQSFMRDGLRQMFGAPSADSALATFGQVGPGAASFDLLGAPRPADAGAGHSRPSVGAIQRNVNGFVITSDPTYVRTGTKAWSCTGWGFKDVKVAVDAISQTLSFYCKVGAGYTGTMPQFIILANEAIGVAQQAPAVAGAGAATGFVQVTLPTITPTAKGVVTVRIIAGDTSGAGITAVDTFGDL